MGKYITMFFLFAVAIYYTELRTELRTGKDISHNTDAISSLLEIGKHGVTADDAHLVMIKTLSQRQQILVEQNASFAEGFTDISDIIIHFDTRLEKLETE